MVRKTCVYGLLAASAIALPAIASAQQPSNYKTPGATTKASSALVCTADYAASVKPVAGWQRTEALTRYGIRPESFTGDLDHLVPVSLGGTSDPDNLYPFHAQGEYTLPAKEQLAAKLHDLVCDGKVTLKQAQDAFKKDWTKSYKQYLGAMNAPGGK